MIRKEKRDKATTSSVNKLRQGLEHVAVAAALGCAAVDIVADAENVVHDLLQSLTVDQLLACFEYEFDLWLQLLELGVRRRDEKQDQTCNGNSYTVMRRSSLDLRFGIRISLRRN
jgi:hypothetical protein